MITTDLPATTTDEAAEAHPRPACVFTAALLHRAVGRCPMPAPSTIGPAMYAVALDARSMH